MVSVVSIPHSAAETLMSVEEGHFFDFKSKRVSPGKLTNTICAFANADGGEVFIGIEDAPRRWIGFDTLEDANGHIQMFEQLFPLGHGFIYSFIRCDTQNGYLLKVEVIKSNAVVKANDEKFYLRRGAQNIPQLDHHALDRLHRNKGLTSFETEIVNTDLGIIIESDVTDSFMCAVLPGTDKLKWMKKQQLVKDNKPTVAGAMLFAEEPQAVLPKRSGVKIYRYQTKEDSERSHLVYDPITMEGCAYHLIKKSLHETVRQIEDI